MKSNNYKAGDKVRIIGNRQGLGCGLRHGFNIGDIVTIEKVDTVDDTLKCSDGRKDQWVSMMHVEPYSFNRDDIKAGYLLEVEGPHKGSTFYMTVAPIKHRDTGALGCCCPGEHWWPLAEFDAASLSYKSFGDREFTILRVYGPTTPELLLANSPEDRELLWERREEPKAVEMTVAEISEKLGYEVKIVKEK